MFIPVIGMITPTVAIVLLVIALIIFGPGKLPEMGKALGRGIKEFKSASTEEEKGKKEQAPQKAEEEKDKEA